ncbi:MAG: UDP-N-acetylmuramoyl-L-alanine--D-glutamate ligase [Burkholderiaceae bacterium]|jgi:UDP-N-acetylmuramoylalanine--D-glutamate ligase|nr:UDP-N-acetylmuramoyl-L-alanine--D-glutamate ligase [Burkholderiaceae bacterium]
MSTDLPSTDLPERVEAAVDAAVHTQAPEQTGMVAHAHAHSDGNADADAQLQAPAPARPTEPAEQQNVADAAVSGAAVPATSASPAEPVPDISTLTAARDAAAFVAQIFADPSVSDPAESEPVPEAMASDAAQASEQERIPVSADWPGDQAQHLRGQRVLILGLGASGLAMARWCVRCGAEVIVADTRETPPQLEALTRELPGVRFVGGPLTAGLVDGQGLGLVYRSPGLSPATVAPVVDTARAQGLPVGGELDLFSMALKALSAAHGYRPVVLGITGTNGKTTVTSLTGQLLEHADMSVAVAGNIGPTLLDTLSERIAGQDLPQAWVLELSSFQLDGVQMFEPTAATVLNITQDHLDWHGSLKAYADAKACIFGQSGVMVLNREDAEVMRMLPPPVVPAGKRQKPQQRAHITFGGDMPQRPGDFGIEVVSGMAWLVRAHEADETAKGKSADDLHIQRLMPADALRIRGRHNAINALSALALASAAGCTLAPLLYGLREYRGEPHRVQPIGRVNGVEYFDDSKGTNVGATVAALSGLGADHRIVVILGGEGKGQDFSPLAAPVSRHVRAAVLIGRDASLIRAALQDCGVPLVDATSMVDAVEQATARAHEGDAVLLSPACASFDMFKSYEDRAIQFVAAVRSLALDAGHELGGDA